MVGVSLIAQIADRLAGFCCVECIREGIQFFRSIQSHFPDFCVLFFRVWSMVCVTFFSVKNFCVEGHATEVWNGVLKRTAWLLKRKQQPGGAIRTEQANLSFHSTWCRYFPSFPSLCEKPYLTSHATHFPPKMRWNVLSLYSPSLEDTFKEEGGIFLSRSKFDVQSS